MQHAVSSFVARRGRRLCAAALLALLAPVANAALAQDIAFTDLQLTGTFGLGYSNGDYGTTRNTNVLLGLPSLSLDAGDFRLSASMPYMHISGRGLVIFDAAGNPIVVNRRTSLPPLTRTGWGDLNLSGSYTIPAADLDGFEVRLTGGVKLPTASTRRRLSTGKTDYSFSTDISHQFGSWTPFLTIGYLIPGQPLGYTLYNTTSVSAGSSVELNSHLVFTASYDYDSASTPLVDASHEIFTSVSWVRENGLTLTGYGTAGLSSGSPNIGMGLLVSYSFN